MADIPPGPPAPREPYSSAGSPPEPPFMPASPGWKLSPRAMIVIGVALIAGAVVGVLLAKGGGDDSGKASGPVAIPAGWTRHDLASEGFTLGLPPGWRDIPPGEVEPALDELRADNPELADLVEGQLQGSLSQLVRFFAFDTEAPSLAEGFATNANVVVEPLQVDVTFEQYLEANVRQLRQVPNVTVTVRDDTLSLPGGRSAVISSVFELKSPEGLKQVDVTQYVFLKGRRGFILSMTTTPAHQSAYRTTFDQIARTFKPV
jgi:hypothetical protein